MSFSHSPQLLNNSNQTGYSTLPGYIAIIVAIAVGSLKFFTFYLTNSTLILSDAMENIVNLISAISLLLTLKIALMPADEGHPYGHGKVEYFSSAFEGGAITIAGFMILWETIQMASQKVTLVNLNYGMWLTLGAGLINGALGQWLVLRGKKIHSMAIESSGRHLLSDLKTSVAVFGGIFLTLVTGQTWADWLLAGLFSLHLAWEGLKILKNSSDHLMDATNMIIIQKLQTLFEKHYSPGLVQIHSLRTVRYGIFHHIDLHLVVPEFWTVEEAHHFGVKLERAIIDDYHVDGELHFHLDPCEKAFCEQCELQNCPIRIKDFKQREVFTIESLLAKEHVH